MHNGAERPRFHVRAGGAGLFAGKPYNALRPPMRIQCRSGFTREYGGGGNPERPVDIGQQARPFRG